MSDRGTDFLESLVDNGDIPVDGNDWLFNNNHTLICRIIKFDKKKNIKKFTEKTDKSGNVMPENTVESLRIWVQPFEHRYLSEGEIKSVKMSDTITLNIKTLAMAPIALLQRDLRDATGNADEICNWKISITRDDQIGKSGYKFTAFIVKKLERIGSDKDDLSALPEAEVFEEKLSIVDKFTHAVKSLDDVIPAFREIAKTPEDRAELKSVVTELTYKFAAKKITESKTPMKEFERIAEKFEKMPSVLERLKPIATAASEAIDNDDIPF